MVIESEIQRATASGQAAPTPTKMRQTWKCVACGGQYKGLDHLQTAAHKSNMEKLREAKTSQLKRKQPLADERTELASRARTPAVATSHYMPGPLAASTNEMRGRDEDHEQNVHESRTPQLKRKLTQSCSSRPNASWSSRTEPASTTRTPAAWTSERMLGLHVYCMGDMKILADEHEENRVKRRRRSQEEDEYSDRPADISWSGSCDSVDRFVKGVAFKMRSMSRICMNRRRDG